MRPARITIATGGPLCRNPRVHREAEALALAGHDVTVVTLAYHARFEAFDDAMLALAHYNKDAIDRTPANRTGRTVSFFERGLTFLARHQHWQSPLALGPWHALRRRVLARPFDLLIAHTELPFSVAVDLQRRGYPVAADFEDWHSRDLLPSARATRPLALIATLERTLLRSALHTSSTSLAMGQALAAAADAPVPIVVPNSLPLTPAAVLQANAPAPDAPPAFIWISQTIGPGRGLEQFLAAWSLTRAPSTLTLLGEAEPAYAAALLASLPDTHRSRLRFHPLVPPADLPGLIAQHHLGLALETSQPPSRDLTITNKIFHYLDSGLAVVATPTAGQREVFSASNEIGLLEDFTSPEVAAAHLDSLLSSPERIMACRRAARRLAENHYCWEKYAPRLIAAVELATSRPKCGS